jgi:hypothetical protein
MAQQMSEACSFEYKSAGPEKCSMTSKLPINLADLLRQHTVEGGRNEYNAGRNSYASVLVLSMLATRQLDKLRQQKHGLMHDLLIGKVRVKPDSKTLELADG